MLLVSNSIDSTNQVDNTTAVPVRTSTRRHPAPCDALLPAPTMAVAADITAGVHECMYLYIICLVYFVCAYILYAVVVVAFTSSVVFFRRDENAEHTDRSTSTTVVVL